MGLTRQLLFVAVAVAGATAASTGPIDDASVPHTYTPHAKMQPAGGAFRAEEKVTLAHCFTACDVATQCAGFTLLDAAGTLVCAYYASAAGLHPASIKDTVAFYEKGAVGPHPPPGPPLPPPPPPPTPMPPPRMSCHSPPFFLPRLHLNAVYI